MSGKIVKNQDAGTFARKKGKLKANVTKVNNLM